MDKLCDSVTKSVTRLLSQTVSQSVTNTIETMSQSVTGFCDVTRGVYIVHPCHKHVTRIIYLRKKGGTCEKSI